MKTVSFHGLRFILTMSLFAITTFTESNAQVVTLPEKTAKFYYERHYRAKTLDQIVVVKNAQIENLERRLLLRDSIINTYKADALTHKEIRVVRDVQTKVLEQDNKTLRKEVRKQKFQKKVTMLVGVGLLTLTLIYGQ